MFSGEFKQSIVCVLGDQLWGGGGGLKNLLRATKRLALLPTNQRMFSQETLFGTVKSKVYWDSLNHYTVTAGD